MEIGSSYTWELTEGNELTDGCFPMLPNGSMIVGTPSALTWNYTGVTEKTTDAKYNRALSLIVNFQRRIMRGQLRQLSFVCVKPLRVR